MTKKITLNHITKIEGHAKLILGIDEGRVTTCELSSVEGARYFEGIVQGRRYTEVHELTSRICGICSCAHVIASIQAVEDAIGFTPSAQTLALRELLTLAERIRSHATHLYFLALPDYLGYESALAMASDYTAELKRALHLMKVGNALIAALGSRDLHPVSAAVGGWLKLPSQETLRSFAVQLGDILVPAEDTVRLFSGLKQPSFVSQSDWFALHTGSTFPVLSGVLTSSTASFEKHAYRDFITEYHEPYSTANFVVKEDCRYMVGALARLNINHTFLSERAQHMLTASGLVLPSQNPFHNNLAQAIELLHCIEEAQRICSTLDIRDEAYVLPPAKQGTGVGCIEVPRGILWHEYTVDGSGVITSANIITPTAQNLLSMQEDIRSFVPRLLNHSREDIILEIEKLIRSYDPCFSCSSHFLEVTWV